MDREEMIQMYSDFHKDVYGFRPRFDYGSFSTEHLELDYKHFDKKIQESNFRESAREEQAIEDFKISIKEVIGYGAKDEDEALQWLVGSELDSDSVYSIQDIEGYVWNQGFLFTDYGRHLVKRIESL